MKDKLDKFKKDAKEVLQSATNATKNATKSAINTSKNVAVTVFDQDGDGKFDQEDVKILTDKATNAGKTLFNKSGEILKKASKTSMAKDTAAGAVAGTIIAVAIPIPIIGPAAGAVVGAGIGAYKNITGKGAQSTPSEKNENKNIDVYAEILKLGDLKEKSLITEDEYNEQKKLLLDMLKPNKT